MTARVIGMRTEDYKRWYADKVQALKTAKTKVAAQQKALPSRTEGEARQPPTQPRPNPRAPA